MKLFFCAMAALAFLAGCSKTPAPVATAPPPPDYRPAISNVFFARLVCLSNSIIIAQPSPAELASAGLMQLGRDLSKDKRPVKIIPRIAPGPTLRKFSESIAAIDTSLCPDDFKTAWKDYVLSTTLSDTPTISDAAEFATAAASISPPAAIALAAAKTLSKENQISTQKEKAFLCLKLSAAAYGVTNFNHLTFQLPSKVQSPTPP